MSSDTHLKSLEESYLARARTIHNPLWDRVLEIPSETLLSSFGRHEVRRGWSPANFDYTPGRPFQAYRDEHVSRYAWAIPAPEVLAVLAAVMDTRGCVEIGAGSGYWAFMLAQLDIDVAAYDIAPIGHGNTWFDGTMRGDKTREVTVEQFYPVHQGGPEVLAHGNHANQVLFLCWPTMSPYAYEAALTYAGDTIAYIGEGPGGCTADADFFRYVGSSDNDDCGCWPGETCECPVIDAAFEEERWTPVPQWGGIHDNLTIYRRKTQ